jgi:pyruvate,water dikinase
VSRLGALVAETGSALSHLAILAREYHVPTVVGVVGATGRFHDGDVVAVDGTTGAVDLVVAAGHDGADHHADHDEDTAGQHPATTPVRQDVTTGARS